MRWEYSGAPTRGEGPGGSADPGAALASGALEPPTWRPHVAWAGRGSGGWSAASPVTTDGGRI